MRNSVAGTDDEFQLRVDRLTSANLPLSINSKSPDTIRGKGDPLLSYLDSAKWQADWSSCMSINLHGNPAVRTTAFQLLGKMFALAGRSTYYCTANRMIYLLDDDEGRHKLTRAECLLIHDFEKTLTGCEGSPFTYAQQLAAEEFLLQRLGDRGKKTMFSSTRSWTSLKWWTPEFLHEFAPRIVDIEIEN